MVLVIGHRRSEVSRKILSKNWIISSSGQCLPFYIVSDLFRRERIYRQNPLVVWRPLTTSQFYWMHPPVVQQGAIQGHSQPFLKFSLS